MRERLARYLALLLVLCAVGLSWHFAWVHNRPAPAPTVREDRSEPTDPGVIPLAVQEQEPAGAGIFRDEGCMACHSVGGVGSPRYPLDGVGTRYDRQTLQEWIVGSERVAAELPDSAVRRKQSYRSLSEAELDALLDWLAGLRD
jgi:cytochrome c553